MTRGGESGSTALSTDAQDGEPEAKNFGQVMPNPQPNRCLKYLLAELLVLLVLASVILFLHIQFVLPFRLFPVDLDLVRLLAMDAVLVLMIVSLIPLAIAVLSGLSAITLYMDGEAAGRIGRVAVVTFCWPLFAVLIFGVFHAIDERVYSLAMRSTAHRGQEIIDALEAYHKARGEYPKTLGPLVPDFIGELPSTGLAGRPEFRYIRGDSTICPFRHYMLVVRFGIEDVTDELLCYLPDKDYEYWVNGFFNILAPTRNATKYTPRWRIEMIGGWAHALGSEVEKAPRGKRESETKQP